ncbi:hypothetical protein N8198_01355 [Gammaproteobacteria bacterium]|nr:hypothetical protein [Gammaproteobacteria bacterium]
MRKANKPGAAKANALKRTVAGCILDGGIDINRHLEAGLDIIHHHHGLGAPDVW